MSSISANSVTPQGSRLPTQRQLEILSELDELGAVRVNTLAQRFSVAEETIRRDLDKLAAVGRLTRTHGGALSIHTDRHDLPFAVRQATHLNEKRLIARLAVDHVCEGDVIAMDASSTVLELACLLPDFPLTVVTNGIDIVRILADRPNVEVVSTGGELDAASPCFLGPIAETTLGQFAINKAFLSCKGIDPDRGLSEASTAQASLKRIMVGLSDRSFLLVDHSKFGVRSMAFFAQPSDLDVLITDDQTDLEFRNQFSTAGVSVETAPITAADSGIAD
jgi:DeoR family L-fucose operon activator